jgi:hypothetical protein
MQMNADVGTQHAESVGTWAGTLSLTELGLGSLLHALHVPLTGTVLSLNQGLFLSRITRMNSLVKNKNSGTDTLAFEVSSVTAILKSMSPVGKRLTPMLAIAVQGFLFTVGVGLFGANIFGVLVGSILLSMWSVAQPAILAGIMFNVLSDTEQDKIFSSWQKMIAGVPFFSGFDLSKAIIGFLLVKCSVGMALALFAWYSPVNQQNSLWAKLERRLSLPIPQRPIAILSENVVTYSFLQKLGLAMRDLKNRMLWLSLALLVGLSYFLDSEWVPALWLGLRSLAAVYIFYVVIRLLPWSRILNSQNEKAAALRSALDVVQHKYPPSSTESRKKLISCIDLRPPTLLADTDHSPPLEFS